jgi:signal peptidase I
MEDQKQKKLKSTIREWIESILIAFVLAMFIRTFFIQAFKIPSGSMRMTLLERDRLMVNKLSYGPKVPLTVDKRLPGYSRPKRGDIVVFIFPDTTLLTVNDIDGWDRLLAHIQQADAKTDLLLRELTPAQLQHFRQQSTSDNLSRSIRQGVVDSLNALIQKHSLLTQVKDLERLLNSDKKLMKHFRQLIAREILLRSEKGLQPGKDLSYREKTGMEWVNLGVLKKLYPDVIEKKLIWEQPKRDFIKRLIAFGGETVEIKDGDIFIDGNAVEDPRIKNFYYYNRMDSPYGKEYQTVKVPKGAIYVLGDNSASSHDSRFWGFVPEEYIIGRAELIYWPLNRMRILK